MFFDPDQHVRVSKGRRTSHSRVQLTARLATAWPCSIRVFMHKKKKVLGSKGGCAGRQQKC